MSKQNDVKILHWEEYYSLLSQGKITTQRPKTAQEIEAEKLMQQCVAAVEHGENVSGDLWNRPKAKG